MGRQVPATCRAAVIAIGLLSWPGIMHGTSFTISAQQPRNSAFQGGWMRIDAVVTDRDGRIVTDGRRF
jgi:hypothetical protein